MKNLILITECNFTFVLLQDTLEKKFQCSLVLDNRLTVENAEEHLFIDFDDSMKDDYDEPEIKDSDCHFYSVLFNSDAFVKQVLNVFSEFQIRVDDDEGKILPIKTFLAQHP